jgi:hypothetical protein
MCLMKRVLAGIAPVINPASVLYNEEVFRTRHLHFDLASVDGADPSGNPYAFTAETLPGFPSGYPIWFDMSLPKNVSEHRLAYLRDAGFFSSRRASRASIQFVGVDVARSTLAFARMQLDWKSGRVIHGEVLVSGMPLPATSDSFWVRMNAP